MADIINTTSDVTLYDENGNPVKVIQDDSIYRLGVSSKIDSFSDELVDSFGRIRVSNPITIFQDKQIFDKQPLLWDDIEFSGSGTSSTYNQNTASTVLSVSNLTAGRRIRQTFQRFNYSPGKSQLIYLTGVLSNGGSGLILNLGLFDDNNGLFFSSKNGVFTLVRRTSTSGSVVDNEVTQDNFNIDKMDGTGQSGITIDLTKIQLFVIDFAWLGAGSIRFGVKIDGKTYHMHQMNAANILSVPFVSIPNLPLRYEIINDGSGGAGSISHTCTAIIGEGRNNFPIGISNSFSNDSAEINANSIGTIYALLGIRLKTTALGTKIRLSDVATMATSGDDYEWMIIQNPTVATPITFNDITNSAIQAGIGNSGSPSSSTLTGGRVLTRGYVKSGASAGSSFRDIEFAVSLGSSITGTRDEIYLAVRPLSASADILGAIHWEEIQ